MERCFVKRVEAAVAIRDGVVASLEARQTLVVESGSLLQTDWPPLRQPISLVLVNVTVRNSENILACRYGELPAQPGRLSLTATGCVLAPRQSVVCLQGTEPPQRALRMIQWTGDASLLDEKGAVVSWQPAPGQAAEQVDDTDLAIDGLARSRLEFAGSGESPTDSQLIKWTAPVGGNAPPGVDAAQLR
jgi:hypothetical protein